MPSFYGKTHIAKRKLNEDRFVADAGWALALVSDGMGGAQAGEVAARIVAENMVDYIDEGMDLRDAVAGTHADVQHAAQGGEGRPGMGATLVAAAFSDHAFDLVWIGDSRAYIHDGALRQITRDHSALELVLATESLSYEQAKQKTGTNRITRAMGLERMTAASVPLLRGVLARGQQLLLCSDGLSDVVSGVEMAAILDAGDTPQQKLDNLINCALDGNGADNITAVLVVADPDAPESDAEPLPSVAEYRADGYARSYAQDGSERQ